MQPSRRWASTNGSIMALVVACSRIQRSERMLMGRGYELTHSASTHIWRLEPTNVDSRGYNGPIGHADRRISHLVQRSCGPAECNGLHAIRFSPLTHQRLSRTHADYVRTAEYANRITTLDPTIRYAENWGFTRVYPQRFSRKIFDIL